MRSTQADEAPETLCAKQTSGKSPGTAEESWADSGYMAPG